MVDVDSSSLTVISEPKFIILVSASAATLLNINDMKCELL